MPGMLDGRLRVCRAKLDNGEIVAYQLCCGIDSLWPTEDEEHYEFIGEGVIHSIDGAEYGGTERHKFYQRRITPLSEQRNPDGSLKYPKKKSKNPFNRYTALTEKNKGDLP